MDEIFSFKLHKYFWLQIIFGITGWMKLALALQLNLLVLLPGL
jgi:hypothetical protein